MSLITSSPSPAGGSRLLRDKEPGLTPAREASPAPRYFRRKREERKKVVGGREPVTSPKHPAPPAAPSEVLRPLAPSPEDGQAGAEERLAGRGATPEGQLGPPGPSLPVSLLLSGWDRGLARTFTATHEHKTRHGTEVALGLRRGSAVPSEAPPTPGAARGQGRRPSLACVWGGRLLPLHCHAGSP